ncbi:hypothetical protein [Halomonas sp.]|uniref:hypothetical protein n=1 Tax=Halomonas sp. TaxID=1486246 RepID=UPI00356961E0
MTNDELRELRDDIVREMYAEAVPPMDYDDLRENPDDYPEEWYKNHYLSTERFREIYDKHIDEAGISRRENTSLSIAVLATLAPTSNPYLVDEVEDDG